VLLHGGWGYEVYGFDSQVERFKGLHRIVAPDRSGFGRSTRTESLPDDFHKAAAAETLLLLDELGINKAIFWGHSDGAVIAAILGLRAPDRALGLILEALHYDRKKEHSVEFFELLVREPERVGQRAASAMSREHGEDYWRTVLAAGGNAWLRIIQAAADPEKDFYDHSLSRLAVPTILIHGAKDPRTEPGELDAVRAELPDSPMRIIEGAGHSPHSEPGARDECNRFASDFLEHIRALNSEH
jgi:pimeloyl-ACP methyl ester carboxylesterase